ncbi:hypothetical protein Bbelb_089180 [Branchiostoma belcheri]|nr:hypothetical protein Bbelb_089180 [Branchiostoma belcheri]
MAHVVPCLLTSIVTFLYLCSAQPVFKPPPDDKCVCNVNCGDDGVLKSELEQLKVAVHQLSQKIDVPTTTGPAPTCQGPVTSFSGRQTIRDDLGSSLLTDHSSSPDNAEKVWYLPTHHGNTIEDLPGSAGSGGMAWWGEGHVVYNNSLYYQRFPDCLEYGPDCNNEKAQIVRYDFKLRAFLALQSLPIAELYSWAAGPTYVYLAVDAGSVWAIGVNNSKLHLTKLNANDLSIEETIDTEFTVGSSNMPPFIACGKLYLIIPDRSFQSFRMGAPLYARTDLILDLATKEKDTSARAWYCLPYTTRRYFSFNSRENKVYTVESGTVVSYNVTVGGPYVSNDTMLWGCTV